MRHGKKGWGEFTDAGAHSFQRPVQPKKGIRRNASGCVVVKTSPPAALEMTEANLLFQFNVGLCVQLDVNGD